MVLTHQKGQKGIKKENYQKIALLICRRPVLFVLLGRNYKLTFFYMNIVKTEHILNRILKQHHLSRHRRIRLHITHRTLAISTQRTEC